MLRTGARVVCLVIAAAATGCVAPAAVEDASATGAASGTISAHAQLAPARAARVAVSANGGSIACGRCLDGSDAEDGGPICESCAVVRDRTVIVVLPPEEVGRHAHLAVARGDWQVTFAPPELAIAFAVPVSDEAPADGAVLPLFEPSVR